MIAETVTIDRAGRMTVPERILEALGWRPETEVIIELTDRGAVIRPIQTATPITSRIADMELPVDDWDRMEEEIELGRLG